MNKSEEEKKKIQEQEQDESDLNITIKKIKIYKRPIRIRGKEYAQYNINLPKSFVDAHNQDKMFAIMDNILIMAPSEETIFKLVKRIPEIEELVKEGKESK